MSELTNDTLEAVLGSMIERSRKELINLTENELKQKWLFTWRENASTEFNVYRFSDSLEMYKRSCRQWEEHHHGNSCVVERVRDKYILPRVREFLEELAKHH